MKAGDICIERKTGEKVLLLNKLNSEEFEVVNHFPCKREDSLHTVNRKDLEEVESEYNIPVTYSMYGIQKVKAKSLDEAIKIFDKNRDDYPLPDNPEYLDDSYCRDENRDEMIPLQ